MIDVYLCFQHDTASGEYNRKVVLATAAAIKANSLPEPSFGPIQVDEAAIDRNGYVSDVAIVEHALDLMKKEGAQRAKFR